MEFASHSTLGEVPHIFGELSGLDFPKPMMIITIFLLRLLFVYALVCIAKEAVRAFKRWLFTNSYCSDTLQEAASSIERRATRADEVQLVEALEFEGETSNDVHTMCAEEAFHEENMRVNKQFYKVWIAAVRLEFPLRSDRPSDRACMTKWLATKMRATGMRVTHMEDAIPRIVRMAINPSRAEVEAEEMGRLADAWRTEREGMWHWLFRGGALRPGNAQKWE